MTRRQYFHLTVESKSFMKFNLFARWVDPQFDDEEQEVEQEENSSPRTEESQRLLQEQHSEEVEMQVIQEVEVIQQVEDPIEVVVEQA